MKADRDYLTATLQKLVRINSVNPCLESGGAGEEEISRFIAHELERSGIPCRLEEIAPGRFNVTARVKGSGAGKTLMLNAHTDTVGVAGMENPFSGEIRDGKLFGRGAYDMKASIAAMLETARMLARPGSGLMGDVLLSFTADEEFESIGAKALVKDCKADAVIVTEPTDLKVCLAHRGFGVYELVTHGKTAHGGRHKSGVDANLMTAPVLTRLLSHSRQLQQERAHPLCGEASLHVPLISGGSSLFIYSNKCSLHIERRTIPGESRTSVMEEFNAMLKAAEDEFSGFRAEITEKIWRSPHKISADAPICRALTAAATRTAGVEPEVIGHTWWEDSAIFAEAGIPAVVFGPSGGGIHEAVEWADLDSLPVLAEILTETALDFCR